MINDIKKITGNDDYLLELSRLLQENQAEAIDQLVRNDVLLAPKEGLARASTSMMSGSFVKSGSMQSRQSDYMNARQAAQQALSAQTNRQNAILAAGLGELASASSIAEQIAAGKRAKKRLMQEKGLVIKEASERNLDEIKHAIEQKAQEAHAPKDRVSKPDDKPIEEPVAEMQITAPALEAVQQADRAKFSSETTVPDVKVSTPSPMTPPINVMV